jgi:hypothetical protein
VTERQTQQVRDAVCVEGFIVGPRMGQYMDKTSYNRGFQDFSTMGHIIINPSMQAAWVFIDNNGKVKPVS